MKLLFSFLLLFVIPIAWATGQTVSLTDDSTFVKAVARTIRYPSSAREQGLVAQVYVGFTVNNEGKITNVKTLNFTDVDNTFRQAVSSAIEQLPARETRFHGDYILPVKFMLEGTNQVKQPADEDRQLIEKSAKKSLLKEIVVVAYI